MLICTGFSYCPLDFSRRLWYVLMVCGSIIIVVCQKSKGSVQAKESCSSGRLCQHALAAAEARAVGRY